MRAVACFDTSVNKAAISDWYCKRMSRKPKDKIPCNRQSCNSIKLEPAGQWIQGEWSRCSVTCDKVNCLINLILRLKLKGLIVINKNIPMDILQKSREFNYDQSVV